VHALYLTSVWLHIMAAAVWIGGTVFLALVVVPAMRRPEYQGIAASLIHWTGMRFRSVAWVCLAFLLLTGAFNLTYRGFEWSDLWSWWLWEDPVVRVLGIKLLLVLVVLLLTVLHDFVVGPRATARWQESPGSLGASLLRKLAVWIGRLNLLLALVIVALGVLLARGWIW